MSALATPSLVPTWNLKGYLAQITGGQSKIHGRALGGTITPELGGADDIRNVWPEPYSGSEWTAHVKDALEEHLHQMVCEKQLELHTAQQEIARDWVSAYKKYFHADHPLPEHLAYTKDEPWQ